MLPADPVVHLVEVVIGVEVRGPRRRGLGLAMSHSQHTIDRSLPPRDEVTGHIGEAPLAHRARFGIARRPDLGGEGAPELLIGSEPRDLLGLGAHGLLPCSACVQHR